MKLGDRVVHKDQRDLKGTVKKIFIRANAITEEDNLLAKINWDGVYQTYDHTVDTLIIIHEPNELLKEIL